MELANKAFLSKYKRLTKADYIKQQKEIEERGKCFTCICGSSLQNRYMLFKHVNSVKHQTYLKNNQ
jgi:hypothetical protein